MLLIAFLVIPNKLEATHSMGADLTYTCLGGNTYEITLSFYRDCNGIDAPEDPVINFESGNCGVAGDLTLIQDSFEEISPICSSQITNSTCNGGNLQGVEEYIYSGVIELPEECSDWVFSYPLCCRNEAITNSVNPEDFELYISTGLDNLNANCNSSPDFTIPPIPYVCSGQLVNYNHGVVDSDGDSLVFSLVAPLSDPTTTVPYVAGFNPNYPISTIPANSFGFDASTGQISFYPDGAQIGILTVLVQEYRDGVLIGYIIRDMQVVVINCSNNNPVIIEPTPAEVSGGTYVNSTTFSVCAGNTLNFTFSASDPDAGQDPVATSNLATAIPGATLSATGTNPVTYEFEWATTYSDVGSHPFALTITDDACPTPGNQIIGFEILVPGVEIEAADTTVCPSGIQMIQLDAIPVGGSGGGTYTWSPTTGLDDPNIGNPIATVNGPTFYSVIYDDGVCVVEDTVNLVIDGTLDVSPPVSNICGSNSVQLNANFQFTVPPPPNPCGISNNPCSGPENTFTIGTATTSTGPLATTGEPGSPYLGYFEDGRVQYLYRANELQAAGILPGLLSELAFNVSGMNSTMPYNNWTIKIGCTAQDELTSSFLFGLEEVYNGTITPTLGWNNYVFTQLYEWDGSSNIVIEICFDNLDYTRYDHVFYTATTYNSVSYTRQDGASGCILTGGTTSMNRPNIQLVNCETSPNTSLSYSWMPTAGLDDPTIATPNASPNVNTVYTVTVDNGDCVYMDSVIVNVAPFTLTTTNGNAACSSATSSVSVTVAGGASPYTYLWSEGSMTSIVNGLPPGTYAVTVTDASSCTATATASVTASQGLALTITGTDIDCSGNMNGSIISNITGGTPPFTYLWDNPMANGANPTNLGTGVYNLSVSDSNGCTGTASATINEPTAISSSITVVDIQCFGDSDGSLTLSVSGGIAPYSFIWDNGLGTVQSPTGVGSGTYTVVITDANGCTATDMATVNEPTNPMTATATGELLDCNGDTDGTITLNVSGGTDPYTFQWDNGAGIGQNPTNLAAGTYTVVVTDTQGCTTTTAAVISEPAAMSLVTTGGSVACNGDATGAISAAVGGGQVPYTYTWDNGAGTTTNPTGLPAGVYNLTVTDGGGCSVFGSATVTEPGALTAFATGQMLACVGDVNGQILLAVNGGVAPYDFDWDNNGGNGQNPEGLEAGVYTVLVTDANACTITASAVVTEPQDALSVSTTGDNLVCYNDTNGALTATASGGTAPYIYTWDNGVGNNQNPSGLGANTYSITVTDANDCSVINFAEITQPEQIAVTTTGSLLDCFGDTDGTVSVSVSNGVPPYTYTWSSGDNIANPTGLAAGTYAVIITDANGCAETGQATVATPEEILTTVAGETLPCAGDASGAISLTVDGGVPPYTFQWDNGAGITQNPTGLSSGTYTVVITDASGCTATTAADIVDPPLFSAGVSNNQNVSCFGGNDGSATANPAGGTPPYTYLWANNQTGQTNTTLTAGAQSVTVTDAGGCSIVLNTTITQPNELFISTSVTNLSCNQSADGSATVAIAAASTPPYLYAWNNGEITATINNLTATSYTVSVTDANGCLKVATVTITEPTAIEILINSQPVSCLGVADGSANASATGGAGGYSYLWDNGQVGNNANFLGAGQHFVTVTDVTGCSAEESFIVADGVPLATSSISSTPVSCYGFADGTATVIVVDGLAPYFYAWDNGQNVQTAVALTAGTYSVIVTDSRGCTSEPISVDVSQPGSPMAVEELSKEDPTCNGANDGSAFVEVLGGTPGYTYLWSNGSVNDVVAGLGAGTYTVNITDSNGCTITDNITVDQPDAVTAEVDTESTSCFGIVNGQVIIANPQGGTAPYFYSLDGVDFGPGAQFIGLEPGDYTGYVKDVNGCMFSEQVTVDTPIDVTLSLGEDIEIVYGDSIELSPTINVIDGLTYEWTPSTGLSCTDCPNPMAKPEDQTTYTLNITEEGGCTIRDDVTIFVNRIRDIFIPTGFSPNGDNINDVFMVHGGDHVLRVRLLRIFDRWGEVIFEVRDVDPNDPFGGWDGTYRGKLMNSGVYTYYVEVRFIDKEIFPFKGDVTLTR